MKPSSVLASLVLTVCAIACAQESTGGRVVVNATVHNGSITVKTYSGKEVIVEPGADVVKEDNVVTVRTHPGGTAHVAITVPADTSLNLKSHNGNIAVEGVHGEIDASSHNGQITLANVSGTVVANAFNGALKVAMDRIDPAKPMSFSTFNGPIDVTFPADLKANIKLKTNHGDVFSDFDIKITGSHPITEKNNTPDGKFRLRTDGTIYGEINGGGPEVSFQSFNGRIVIRKK